MHVELRSTLDATASGKTFFNDAVANGAVTNIKTTAGLLYSLSLTNTVNATSYLQIFFQPAAQVTLGTTAPDYVIRLPPSALAVGSARDIQFPVPIGGFILAGGSLGANKSGLGTGLSIAGTTTPTGKTGAAISVAAIFF